MAPVLRQEVSIISLRIKKFPHRPLTSIPNLGFYQFPYGSQRPDHFRSEWKWEGGKDLGFSRSLLPDSGVEDFYSIFSINITNTTPNSGCSDQIPVLPSLVLSGKY